jgi:hypothetical protein
VPLAWAATQNNLGKTLAVLGERETGTTRRIVKLRAALQQRVAALSCK